MLSRGSTQILRVPEKLITGNPEIVQKEGLKKYGDASEIIEGRLYLGSCYNARDMQFLQENAVSHIINVAEEIEMREQDGIKSIKLLIYDAPKNGALVEDCLSQFVAVVNEIGTNGE